jgi:arsenate reductase (thioredoxin)
MEILIICTGNSCRSQMAEGFFKYFREEWLIKSAGITPTELNHMAVEVMKERGIDISMQSSKGLDMFLEKSFDYVITVCENARESCPIFPGETKKIHWNFKDPAKANGGKQQKLKTFRSVRDEIEKKILEFLERT